MEPVLSAVRRTRALVLIAAAVGLSLPASASDSADFLGDWTVELSGTAVATQRTPARLEIAPLSTTLTVRADGDILVVDLGGIGSELSAHRLTGSAGEGRLVAVWVDRERGGSAVTLTAELAGGELRGRLLVARTGAGEVRGWTELDFVARRSDARARAPRTPPGVAAARLRTPPGRPGLGAAPRTAPVVSGSPASESAFRFETLAVLEPPEPTVEQPVRFFVRAEAEHGVRIERVELRVGGRVVALAESDRIEHRAAPLPLGTTAWSLVAFDTDGRRAEGESRALVVRTAGRAVVEGRISGRLDRVSEVQLVDDREAVVFRTRPDASGRYRFGGVAAGRYRVFVDDGKREARISLTRGSQPVETDGTGKFTLDFRID